MDLLLPPLSNTRYLEIVSRPLFTPAECDRIVGLLDDGTWSASQIERTDGGGSYHDVRPDERSVTQQSLPDDGSGWPLLPLLDALAAVNDEVHRFDLWSLPAHDAPSVLRYETASNDHFRPHADAGGTNVTRKLSYSVQLSPADAYTGCDLVFPMHGVQAPREQGMLTVFPSFHFHTVTPVYSGVRYAVVGWVHGPSFR